MRFVWDPIKDVTNKKKHHVSFEDAVTTFLDKNALRIFDNDHSEYEDRWILLGLSHSLKLLVVIHLVVNEDTIRIISARKASKDEKNSYLRKLK